MSMRWVLFSEIGRACHWTIHEMVGKTARILLPSTAGYRLHRVSSRHESMGLETWLDQSLGVCKRHEKYALEKKGLCESDWSSSLFGQVAFNLDYLTSKHSLGLFFVRRLCPPLHPRFQFHHKRGQALAIGTGKIEGHEGGDGRSEERDRWVVFMKSNKKNKFSQKLAKTSICSCFPSAHGCLSKRLTVRTSQSSNRSQRICNHGWEL